MPPSTLDDGTAWRRRGISRRELEVLAGIGDHLTNAEIAARHYVSVRTVESQVSSLLRKLDAANRRELAMLAPTYLADREPVESHPVGVHTFMFTDIVSSTELWDRHQADMQPSLERHDVIVQAAISKNEGAVFATGGDGFAAVFHDPLHAIEAAAVLQRGLAAETWPASTPIAVRVGVHTGDAHERDGEFFGPAVNTAARVMPRWRRVAGALVCRDGECHRRR